LYSEDNPELTFLELLVMLFSHLSDMAPDNPIFKDLNDWCKKASNLL
jgi:hypothetical protein